MQNAHVRHQLHLYGKKIALASSLCLLVVASAVAQQYKYARPNNPNYDDRKISYGFLIGIHSSMYNTRYSDQFVTQELDTVFAVNGNWKGGFTLGFIVNYRAEEFLDFRITPQVTFYEHELDYLFTNETSERQLVESTMVELPMLAKYKSMRRGNIRMYMIGGIKPGFEASGSRTAENETRLEVKNFNLSIEGGFGFDLYYPLFKFSPEIRFSRGVANMLDNTTNPYGQPLRSITTNTVTVYLLFQ